MFWVLNVFQLFVFRYIILRCDQRAQAALVWPQAIAEQWYLVEHGQYMQTQARLNLAAWELVFVSGGTYRVMGVPT